MKEIDFSTSAPQRSVFPQSPGQFEYIYWDLFVELKLFYVI